MANLLALLRFAALACAALGCVSFTQVTAAATGPADLGDLNRVKAEFLYKFADYVGWPDGSFAQVDSPITIGVLGDDQIAAELAELVAGRKVAGRPVAARRLREGDSATDVHVLFIGRAANPRLAQLLKSVQSRPVLTVTEADAALAQGSIINFVLVEGRVRFEIALDTAESKGLRLSSQLLSVALNVRPGVR